MSIFKRFSGKKSGSKAQSDEDLVLDEDASLLEEDSDTALPVSDDDAIPSLKGFSEDERNVIKSILTDKKLPRSDVPEPAPIEEMAAAVAATSNRKTTSDILSDDSYKSALSVLKGDLEIDEDEVMLTTDLDTSKADIRETEENRSIAEEWAIRDDLEQAAQTDSTEELEINTGLHSDNALLLGEEDMTSESETDHEPVGTRDIETMDGDIHVDTAHTDIAGHQKRINLGEMRMDVANIMSDIESGDSMYRRAQQRVENLTNFIQRAEVDFSLLDRLEPENRALKSENMSLSSELDKRKSNIAQLTSSLEDLQRRYGDTQSELDATQSKLAQSIKNHERAERDISELNGQLQETRLKHDRMRNEVDVENRENSNLRGKISEITSQMEKVTSEKLNFAKQIQTLKIDVGDQTENRLKLRDEVGDLRHALDEAQRQNTKMRGEIGTVHEDIRGFKTQYEFNILKRDERISDLEAQLVELNDRVRMKEEIIENTTRDISNLRKERTAQDLERERLEQSVADSNAQLLRTEEELLRSRKAVDEVDLKYREIEATLARNEQQRQSSAPAARPDIAPPPMPEVRAAAPAAAAIIQTDDISIDDSEAPTAERIAPTRQISDDIEDMLTDYKLGLRQLG